jgi:hypothetical protein
VHFCFHCCFGFCELVFELGGLVGGFCELVFELGGLVGGFCELVFELGGLVGGFCELVFECGYLVVDLRCLACEDVLLGNESHPATFLKAELPREHYEQPGCQNENSGWESVGQSENETRDDYSGVDTTDRGEVPPSESEEPPCSYCRYCHRVTLGAERDRLVKRLAGDPFVLAQTSHASAMALLGPAGIATQQEFRAGDS